MGARGPIGIGRPLALAALGCVGCNALLGLEDGILVEDGAGAAQRCEPLSVAACYGGPPETAGVGACRAGVRQCSAAGDGYGPCEGEVTPAPERCGNALDDDCDGAVDEAEGGEDPRDPAGGAGCACEPGVVEACPYGGPPETAGVGACRAGQRTCGSDGRWGPCAGEITPRAEDCATPADEDCSGGRDCGAVLSGGLLGGAGQERARALAAGSGGAAIVGGEFEGGLDLGAGPIASGAERDVFVARIEADGAVSWARRLVDEGHGRLRALAADPGGEVVLTGDFQGVIGGAGLTTPDLRGFVLKLDARGGVRWGATLHGEPRDVAISTAGEVVVASSLAEPAGGSDVAVARFSAGGLPLWTRVFGGAGVQEPTGVAMDARGRVVVTGSFEGELALGEGAPRLSSAGMTDVFVAQLDAHGEPIASRAFGDGREQRGGDVEIGPDGGIALSGTFEGLLDAGGGALLADGVSAFVVALGPAREHRFSRAYGAHAPPRLALAADGGLVLAGDVDRPVDLGGGPLDGEGGGADIVVARLDGEGRHVWSTRLGPGARRRGGERRTAGVAVDPDRGGVLLAATVEGSVNLGGVTAASAAADLLLLRLAP
ncbi:hypothetical protein WMF31_11590 [Sorangium sp. So ce1036]|uniref:hypothetical protein n=1 Tax=Sorangium sp. So ce1036 TaxID=3133328 RepID=UPI003F08DBD4